MPTNEKKPLMLTFTTRDVANTALVFGISLMPVIASAEISAADAHQRLIDTSHLATSFQLPTDRIDTGNYGYKYAQKWTAASPYTLHAGTDINTTNDCGRRVVAIGNGVVRYKGVGGPKWGGVILIQHRYWDETNRQYSEIASQYAHVAPLDNLAENDLVTAGQHIGYIADSTTGNCTSFQGVANYGTFDVPWSPHLHFEIRTTTAFAATRWSTAANFQAVTTCANILDATATCRVSAVNAVGYTSPESWIVAHANVIPPTPSAPVGLTIASATTAKIVLIWTDNSNNETGFKVERKISPSTVWNRVATVAADTTTYTSNNVTAGVTYFFRVKATNSVNDSASSNEVSVTAGAAAKPNSPTSLLALAASSSGINLSWNDNSTNETGFKLERKTGTGGWALVKTLNANIRNYADSGLSSATLYSFRISATNGAGDSAYSNESTATTLGSIPSAPSGLTASAVSKTQINLSWIDNSNNETGFKIDRRLGFGAWGEIATVGTNIRVYSNSGLAAGRSYGYRVRAYNGSGDSSYTTESTASTPR